MGASKQSLPGCARSNNRIECPQMPVKYRYDKDTFDYAETLGKVVQRFADVLEKELKAIE